MAETRQDDHLGVFVVVALFGVEPLEELLDSGASLYGGSGEVAACTLGDQEQQRMVGGKGALCCRF